MADPGNGKTEEMTTGQTDVKKWNCEYLEMKRVHWLTPGPTPRPPPFGVPGCPHFP